MSDDRVCITSFASHGRENYNKAQLRLIRSCVENNWNGDYYIRSFDGYVDEYLGVPLLTGTYPITKRYGLVNNHAEVSYGFKPALIQEVREKGYTKIIWADSTIVMCRDPKPMLDKASKTGICVCENLGHPLKDWLNDHVQDRLEITDEELVSCKQIMACLIVFDFSLEITNIVFDQWLEMSRDGMSFQNTSLSTRKGFKHTRHDQSCLSAIIYKHNMVIEPYGWLSYPTAIYDNPKPCFLNKGI